MCSWLVQSIPQEARWHLEITAACWQGEGLKPFTHLTWRKGALVRSLAVWTQVHYLTFLTLVSCPKWAWELMLLIGLLEFKWDSPWKVYSLSSIQNGCITNQPMLFFHGIGWLLTWTWPSTWNSEKCANAFWVEVLSFLKKETDSLYECSEIVIRNKC